MRAAALALSLSACAVDGYDADACTYVTDDHVEEGYALAESLYGSEECVAERPVEYRLVTGDNWPPHCDGEGDVVIGCAAREVNTGLYVVWLGECQLDPVGTAAHERLHALLDCETGDPDGGHERPEWEQIE